MLRQAVRGALGLSPHPPGAALPLPLASMLHASFSTDEGERERVISIDRSGLLRAPPHSHDPAAQQHKEPETELVRHLKSLIRVSSCAGTGRAVLRAQGYRRQWGGGGAGGAGPVLGQERTTVRSWLGCSYSPPPPFKC